ncbi:MAG TPA: hypothetical protein VLF90_01945 [Patescibacteria group bacterium]|nr:hypothetical protein [Patescibacteria group bacterium]
MATKQSKRPVSKKLAASLKRKNPMLRKLFFMAVLPALVYFLFFTVYSWPWMSHFNTHIFTDSGDGFQNVWNIWWVNKSITQLHQLPWHTTFVHYPYGTTLIAQTLNPFNGFVGIGLLKIFSLAQTYNIMVIFSFLSAGVTMFWLCNFFTRRYLPSLIGGFIYTFSSYHFAHAIGHMQLVSLEWIPLFVLLWWKLVTKPRYRLAVGAALVLLLVLLCDYYYFLYSVVLAVLIFIYLAWRKEIPPWRSKQTWRPYLTFTALSALFVLPLPLLLTITNARDPLQGSHPGRVYSTDIFTPFIDGSFWHFHSWTDGYWRKIKAGMAEGSIYLTLSVTVLMIVAVWKRTKIHRDTVLWLVIAVLFGVMSLGERLMVFGYSINHAPMPYALLEKILPQLKLSGVPVRMMIMVIFASAIISAMVLSKINLKQRKGQILMAAFTLLLIFELWPAPLPNNTGIHAPYVYALSKLPATGGVLDNAAISETTQLYDQTISNKPMVLGYISRTPLSVTAKDNQLIASLNSPKGYQQLCAVYKVRYYTTPAYRPLEGVSFPVVYRDSNSLIYDLKNSPNC